MSALFSGSLGMLYPLMLLFGVPAIAALIYAYLRRGKGKRVIVASTLIMAALQKSPSSRERFVPPLRFFFELLLLLLLLAGAAGLYSYGDSSRISIIVDNSMSMSAQDQSRRGKTLLEVAKQEARVQAQLQSSNSTFHIWVTSPSLRLLTNEFTNKGEALKVIDSVQQAFGADALASAIDHVDSREAYAKVIVVSDKKPQFSSAESRVSFKSIGAPIENIAITNLSFKQKIKGEKSKLTATIQSFASSERTLRVEAHALLSGGVSKDLVELESKLVTVFPKEPALVNFEIPNSDYTAYEVKIQAKEDPLQSDNLAWIGTSAKGESVLLVGDVPAESLGLQQIPGVSFEYITPSMYESGNSKAKQATTIVFHRYTPNLLPKANSLFIYPPSDSSLFRVGKQSSKSSIARWQKSHPSLSYLSLSTLSLKNSRELKAPSWGRELIISTEGTVAFSGQKSDYRYLALGFEIFPYEGKKALVTSILTLNVLKWLSGAEVASGYMGLESDSSSPVAGRVVNYLRPSISTGEVADRLGLAVIEYGNNIVELIGVNYFDEQESNTFDTQSVTIRERRKEVETAEHSTLFSALIALLVFILLVLDLVVTTRGFGFLKRLKA